MEPGNEDSGWSYYHIAQTSGWGTSENTSNSCSERVFEHRIVSLEHIDAMSVRALTDVYIMVV